VKIPEIVQAVVSPNFRQFYSKDMGYYGGGFSLFFTQAPKSTFNTTSYFERRRFGTDRRKLYDSLKEPQNRVL
jgi:hypothetical protein